MFYGHYLRVILLLSLIVFYLSTFGSSFKAGKGSFLLDGQPFVVKAAELHYPRIPEPYWDHRIKMSKALGMNTVCLYVFWNLHEPEQGKFDFDGGNNLRKFVELCRDNDMKVILRPGPYVCAEWEMGGLPWWLLKDKEIRLRENDPRFLKAVGNFERRVAQELGDLTIDKGGPIIMIQVENEYGSYGIDKEYVGNIRDIIRENYGPDITLFQCDWSSNFTDNGLDDLVWTMNFGTGADIESQFKLLKELRPESPLMCSEFWSGWFDKWGADHETRPADEMIAGIEEMLSNDISFSLYMTHGGTNWGHWAGANSPGYAPDVTSYDYDAPISESGGVTSKYHQLRNLMARFSDQPLPEVPEPIPSIAISTFRLDSVSPLFENLPHSIADKEFRNMESYDQGFGSILYQTTLPPLPQGGVLKVCDPHDFAQVFVDEQLIGILDRRLDQAELQLPAIDGPTTLRILVEAMGRINFGRAIKDFKGITQGVVLSRNVADSTGTIWLSNELVYLFPDELDTYRSDNLRPVTELSQGNDSRLPRGVYSGKFMVEKPGDTFLNLESWGKGLVFVNGHQLGRFWDIGPQQTLYTPGCWLKEGENEILIFDILGPRETLVEGLNEPILNHTGNYDVVGPLRDASLSVKGLSAIAEDCFDRRGGWQTKRLSTPAKGRYLYLEMLSSADDDRTASIAEINLIDRDGNRLARDGWKIVASGSMKQGNHTPDKIIDLQESTYWSSNIEDDFPYLICIDMGESSEIVGIEYLPRMESGQPGCIGRFRLYITD